MQIKVKNIVKKDVETIIVVNVPAYYKHGWSMYAILSEKNYLEARADEMNEFKLSTWTNESMVASVVDKGTPITAEEFLRILNLASEGIKTVVSELSMTEFMAGATEKAPPEEIEETG